jgi:hypothetical protein
MEPMSTNDDPRKIEELIASLVGADHHEEGGLITEHLTFESEDGRIDLIPDHDQGILHLESLLVRSALLPEDNRIQELLQPIVAKEIQITLNPDDFLLLSRRLEIKGLDAGTLSEAMASFLDTSSLVRNALLLVPESALSSDEQSRSDSWIPA